MQVLGLQGSPRSKGNDAWLLNTFMEECRSHGAQTHVVETGRMDIQPCRELTVCEKKGICPIDDAMNASIYAAIRNADLIVLSTPVFFYGVSAQLKALIDRCQMFWSRKYKLGMTDPMGFYRRGFVLSVAASGGKKLFDGIKLTTDYFFDAVAAIPSGSLTFRHQEGPGEISENPEVAGDIQTAVANLMRDEAEKPSVLFLSDQDACRSQMAAAFLRSVSRGEIRVFSAGINPAADIAPDTVKAMADKKLDILYRKPGSIKAATPQPARIVLIGDAGRLEEAARGFETGAAVTEHWDIEPSTRHGDSLLKVRDKIEVRIKDLYERLTLRTD